MRKIIALILCISIAAFLSPQVAFADTIAFDASSSGFVVGASSFSFNHTMSAGANGILICFTQQDATGGSKVTGVTFNSVAMTQIGTGASGPSGTNGYALAWYLVAPSSGTHSVTVSASVSSTYYAICESFTGASQTGQPDASFYGNTTSTTNQTGTVTTVADNSWAIQFTRSAQTLSAGTNCTYRANTEPFATIKSCDSNAAITPAGSYSITQTTPIADNTLVAMVSISPATAAPAVTATPILGLVQAFWIW